MPKPIAEIKPRGAKNPSARIGTPRRGSAGVGRPAKSSIQHLLNGTQLRSNLNPPESSGGLGRSKMSYFTQGEWEVWERCPGVWKQHLSEADIPMLQLYCQGKVDLERVKDLAQEDPSLLGLSLKYTNSVRLLCASLTNRVAAAQARMPQDDCRKETRALEEMLGIGAR